MAGANVTLRKMNSENRVAEPHQKASRRLNKTERKEHKKTNKESSQKTHSDL